jgi:2'-5' RNA ligase
METIRAFIAVDIGNGIRQHLDELQRILRNRHAGVRWVKPDGIHLTLAFLGDLAIDRIPPLKRALDNGLEGVHAFEMAAAGTGFFGRASRPRVIWAGIADCPPLKRLQHCTVAALQDAGIAFDRKPFSPHLTLGRIKVPERTEALLKELHQYRDRPLGHTRIDRVQLIQSRLTPAGAEYENLHVIPLVENTGC